MNNLHVCHDAVLTWDEQVEAAVIAAKETITNAIVNPKLLVDAAAGGYDINPMAAVLLRSKMWQNGREITIGFLDGDTKLQALVREQADTWMKYINLKFVWVTDAANANIRITFNRGGSWSYLGTDNLSISKPKPTMQYGWLTETSKPDEIRRVVVHEFGHMLGLGHEQGHPTGNIPWDKPKVYDYYRRTNGWDEATVNSQVFAVYSTGQTNFSSYDRFSIMHYSIPAELLTDASKAVGWNTSLSPTDIAFMQQQYPKAVAPPKPQRPWQRNGWYEGRAGKNLTYWLPSSPNGSGDYKQYGWWELNDDKSLTRFGPQGEF